MVNGTFQPVLLIVRPSLGVKTVDEFVAYAKKNPGKLSFGVQGIGGEMHLSLEHFKKNRRHGNHPSAVQCRGSRRSSTCSPIGSTPCSWSCRRSKLSIEAGKLLALATLNAKRIAALPNVPTMAELGRPEMTSAIWRLATWRSAKTPGPLIAKLVAAFKLLQSDAALAERVEQTGAVLDIAGPAEFSKIITEDRARYGKIVAEGNSRQAELKTFFGLEIGAKSGHIPAAAIVGPRVPVQSIISIKNLSKTYAVRIPGA